MYLSCNKGETWLYSACTAWDVAGVRGVGVVRVARMTGHDVLVEVAHVATFSFSYSCAPSRWASRHRCLAASMPRHGGRYGPQVSSLIFVVLLVLMKF